MRAWNLIAVPIAASLLFPAGCHSTQTPVIAVVPQTTAQELWESEHAGVEAAARPLHWQIYWNGPSREDDVPRQVQIVDRAVARGVSGLILSPDHAIALITPVRSAIAHGIPTVILGSRLATSSNAKLTFVLNDEVADGQLAAQRAEKYLHPGDGVAVLGIDPNLLGTVDRADAFEAGIHQELPSVRIVERRMNSFSFAEDEELAEEVIHSAPGIRVLLSLNVNQTRAAYQALLDTGQLHHIVLIGCDQDLDLVHHLRTGGIDALVIQNTYQMGVDAIESIQHQRLGQIAPERILVRPMLVTTDNVDSGVVQKALDMGWWKQ